MAVFVQNRLILAAGEDGVKQHPQHCEEEENDEEDLSVLSSDRHAVEGAPTDQSTAQDQDVDADDAREEPSATVVVPLPRRLQTGSLGRTGQMLDVVQMCCRLYVGGMRLCKLPLLIFCFSVEEHRVRRQNQQESHEI